MNMDPLDISEANAETQKLPKLHLRSDDKGAQKLPKRHRWSDDEEGEKVLQLDTLERNEDTQKLSKLVEQKENEGYSALLQRLAKNSGIYALASLTSPLVSLVLAPFLTHNLSRSDYGALVVLNTFVALIAGVTQLGLNSAFFRAYEYDYTSKRDRLDVVSTLFLSLLLISLGISVVELLVAPFLAVFLLGSLSFTNAIRVCALVIIIQNLTVPGLCWLRAESRATFFSIVSIINLLLSAGATIIFVGRIHLGIEGALLASAVGNAVIVIATLPAIIVQAGLRLRLDIGRGMLVFGVSHMFSLLSTWILQLMDRYLLGLLGSLVQVASYSIAYSLGGALSTLLIAPFSLAWWVILYSIAKRNDAVRVFQLIFRWYAIVALFMAFGLSIVGVIVLDLFFPPSYVSATPIIPVIALSMVFNAINIIVALGISLTRKTWFATIAITSSALINTLLNFVLIPVYGAMGAALATLVAYIALSVISYAINQRLYPVPFEIGRFLLALFVGIALYIGSSWLGQGQSKYVAWGIAIGALVVYGGCLLFWGISRNKYTDGNSIKIWRNLPYEGSAAYKR